MSNIATRSEAGKNTVAHQELIAAPVTVEIEKPARTEIERFNDLAHHALSVVSDTAAAARAAHIANDNPRRIRRNEIPLSAGDGTAKQLGTARITASNAVIHASTRAPTTRGI